MRFAATEPTHGTNADHRDLFSLSHLEYVINDNCGGSEFTPTFVKRWVLGAVAVLAIAMGISVASAAAPIAPPHVFDTLAASGDVLPDESNAFPFEGVIGWEYMNGQGFHLNNLGQLSFVGQLNRANTRFQGIWVTDNITLTRAAREGEQAPGVPTGGLFWAPFKTPIVDDHGNVTFVGLLRQGTGGITLDTRDGIWSGPPSDPNLILQTGIPIAGFSGRMLTGIEDMNVGSTGQFVFTAGITPGTDDMETSNSLAILSYAHNELSIVARHGFQAPGAAPGRTLDLSRSNSGEIRPAYETADSGEVVVLAQLDNGNRGIWSYDEGVLASVVLDGHPVPGIADAQFARKSFRDDTLQLSPRGNLAFVGRMEEGIGGVTSSDWLAVWAGTTDRLEVAVRQGDQAPGFDNGVLHQLFLRHAINDRGLITVLGTVRGPEISAENDHAIWLGTPGNLQPVVREGDPVPGFGDGFVFGDLGSSTVPPILNRQGQVLLHADIRDTLTNQEFDAMWLYTSDTGMRLLAKEGDVVQVRRGDLRTIDNLFGVINDEGNIGMRIEFTDDSFGLFSTTIPEPSTVTLLALALICGLRIARSSASNACSLAGRH